jgi:hypothetical protein
MVPLVAVFNAKLPFANPTKAGSAADEDEEFLI